jgi:hypothetical protein
MRAPGFCIAGIAAALLMVDYGAAGNSGRLIVTGLQSPPSEQAVVRDRKADRLPLATTMQIQPARPAVRDAPQSEPLAKPQPARPQPALLKGCEPALSPLTGVALTGLHARCVADAGNPTRLAALT